MMAKLATNKVTAKVLVFEVNDMLFGTEYQQSVACI